MKQLAFSLTPVLIFLTIRSFGQPLPLPDLFYLGLPFENEIREISSDSSQVTLLTKFDDSTLLLRQFEKEKLTYKEEFYFDERDRLIEWKKYSAYRSTFSADTVISELIESEPSYGYKYFYEDQGLTKIHEVDYFDNEFVTRYYDLLYEGGRLDSIVIKEIERGVSYSAFDANSAVLKDSVFEIKSGGLSRYKVTYSEEDVMRFECKSCFIDKIETTTSMDSIIVREYHQDNLLQEKIRIFSQGKLSYGEERSYDAESPSVESDRAMSCKQYFDYRDNRIYVNTVYANGTEVSEIIEVN